MRATGNRPASLFQDIYRDVVDDYGKVTERTVSRYIVKAVENGRIVDVDVQLPGWIVYMPPGARMLRRPPEAIREYIFAEHDHPALVQSKRSHTIERHGPFAPRAPRAEITEPKLDPSARLRRAPRQAPGIGSSYSPVEETNGHGDQPWRSGVNTEPIAETARPRRDHG